MQMGTRKNNIFLLPSTILHQMTSSIILLPSYIASIAASSRQVFTRSLWLMMTAGIPWSSAQLRDLPDGREQDSTERERITSALTVYF